MGAFKKLNQQDAYISTYTARKSWIASGSQYPNLGILNLVGESGSGAYIPDESNIVYGGGDENASTASFDKRLIYQSINQLYYSNFSSSVIPISNSFDNYLQSSFNISGSRNIDQNVAVFSLPKEIYGTHIEPLSITVEYDTDTGEQYVLNNYATTGGIDSDLNADNQYAENTGTTIASGSSSIVDDGEGNLILKNVTPTVHVGNVIYPHGQLIITDNPIAQVFNSTYNARLEWKSNLPIYTHNYHCRVKANELNFSLNKTAVDQTTGQIKDNISGSAFQPYVSTIGLYNDANELIAVAKTASPTPKSTNTDMSFHIKLDMNFGVDRFKQKVPLTPPEPNPFILEFTVTAGQTIRLDATGTNSAGDTTDSDNYDCFVRWGDGEQSPHVKGNGNTVWNGGGHSRHTYTEAGTYYVEVVGQMPVVNFSGQESNNTTLTDVVQWGSNKWEDMSNMFHDVSSLTNISATDSPNFTNLNATVVSTTVVSDYNSDYLYAGQLDGVFRDTGLDNVNFLQYWDMSGVENVYAMFRECSMSDWSGLQNWDVSGIKHFSQCFLQSDIGNTGFAYTSGWDFVSLESIEYITGLNGVTSLSPCSTWLDNNNGNLTSLENAFAFAEGALDFNDISGWDVSNVTSMLWMLYADTAYASSGITSLDGLQHWETPSLESPAAMLRGNGQWLTDATALASWDISSLKEISYIFRENAGTYSSGKYSFLDSWIDGSKEIVMDKILNESSLSGTFDATGWNLSAQIDGSYIFASDTPINSSLIIDVTGWDVSNFTGVQKLFHNWDNATITGLDTWNLDSLENYFEMFENMKSFTGEGIEDWDMSGATNISEMLYDCDSFDTDISGWDITGITEAADFMANATGMSTTNYDALLIGWEATLQTAYPGGAGYPGIDSINFGGSSYTSGGAAETARTSLINTFSWSISDGGPV